MHIRTGRMGIEVGRVGIVMGMGSRCHNRNHSWRV